MITITEAATHQLRQMLADRGVSLSEHGLRLFVEKGGCAGMSYAMKVSTPAATDIVIKNNGVQVYIDQDSSSYLRGITLDYVEALNDSGFKIENPNAARSCGCGTSFEPASTEKDPQTMDGAVCGGTK
jgi:iron-sulfur cluster assembly accessory protein